MAAYWEGVRVEGQDMQCYVSMPEAVGTYPAVIVIMEAFGVNQHIRDVADRLAKEGYVTIAPALYHREGVEPEAREGSNPVFGYGTEVADARSAAMAKLRDDSLAKDINASITYLKTIPRVDGDSIGIVGFCVGGRITYLAATSCAGLKAASVFYGGRILIPFGDGPAPIELTKSIECPVLGSFGDLDQNPTPADVSKIEALLKQHGKVHDFKMYPGAGHGFFCDERDSYHEPSAKDAWARTLAWFEKYLKAPVGASR